MNAHTPEPWTLIHGGKTVVGPHPQRKVVACSIENPADGRLIAASPEILAAVNSLLALCPSEEGLGGHAPVGALLSAASNIRAVLKKHNL